MEIDVQQVARESTKLLAEKHKGTPVDFIVVAVQNLGKELNIGASATINPIDSFHVMKTVLEASVEKAEQEVKRITESN